MASQVLIALIERWLSSATKGRRNHHDNVEIEIWWSQEIYLEPSC